MKLRRFVEPDSDESIPTDVLYFDLYAIADRMLEGFVVKIELTESGDDLKITPLEPWPKGIDSAYWTQQVKEIALNGEELITGDDQEGYVDVEI